MTKLYDNEPGKSWVAADREQRALDRHDEQHPGDPALYWGECSRCAERVDRDIQDHKRCEHGIKLNERCGFCDYKIERAIENDIAFKEHGE